MTRTTAKKAFVIITAITMITAMTACQKKVGKMEVGATHLSKQAKSVLELTAENQPAGIYDYNIDTTQVRTATVKEEKLGKDGKWKTIDSYSWGYKKAGNKIIQGQLFLKCVSSGQTAMSQKDTYFSTAEEPFTKIKVPEGVNVYATNASFTSIKPGQPIPLMMIGYTGTVNTKGDTGSIELSEYKDITKLDRFKTVVALTITFTK